MTDDEKNYENRSPCVLIQIKEREEIEDYKKDLIYKVSHRADFFDTLSGQKEREELRSAAEGCNRAQNSLERVGKTKRVKKISEQSSRYENGYKVFKGFANHESNSRDFFISCGINGKSPRYVLYDHSSMGKAFVQ